MNDLTIKKTSHPNSILKDTPRALYNSRIFRAIVLGALMYGASKYLHLSSDMVIAASVGGFAIGLFAQCLQKKGWQNLSFELSNIGRLWQRKSNYSTIFVASNNARLILGAQPNRLVDTLDRVFSGGRTTKHAVLSLNESWEREARFLSFPYTQAHYDELSINYTEITTNDHAPVSVEDLGPAANWIHHQIDAGRDVYVHCRAGKGRSAMAIAAYLIQHQEMNVEDATKQIKDHRPVSTIQKKSKQTVLGNFRSSLYI